MSVHIVKSRTCQLYQSFWSASFLEPIYRLPTFLRSSLVSDQVIRQKLMSSKSCRDSYKPSIEANWVNYFSAI